ncbi:ATP-dependent DNA helicase RecG [Corynebacterium confusum]|uniref:ATP-dependent DNA helicase RecG n=1 Tax=Corynebacterium confusum TaxID=71254 RepID=UPI0025B59803|nr:ATP-dependent DNA helicase RecG [Corynebacterium confusum]WJY89630.1 ATP-dependent DNA helicase RecG [Corynebacterium confusum]
MLGWRDERKLSEVLDPKQARRLEAAFGYTTCGQLLEHYPRDYMRHGYDVGIADAAEGDHVTLSGVITRTDFRPTSRRGVLRVFLDNGLVVSFFNPTFQRKFLQRGRRAMFSGKLQFFRGTPQLQHPDFVMLDSHDGTVAGSGALRGLASAGELEEVLSQWEWIPVYPASEKAPSWLIMMAVKRVLDTLPPVPEPLDQRQMVSFDTALRQVHQPGPAGPQRAIQRLKYNEALGIGLVMALRHRDVQSHRAKPLPPLDDGFRAELLGNLPFELTNGQKRVTADISHDMTQEAPMARLLQGEVGSGKTMVSVLAMLQAADAGFQAALLAPTEVLAAQHYESVTATVPADVKVVCLTGSMKAAEKRQALLDIVSGDADIVIGTHAIIQDKVEFFDLGLVVVDEQHRFGVEQREALRTKSHPGFSPHLLVMTATPIPRTVAMTVFADLAVSTLTELPGGRKPIQTSVVPEWMPSWVSRALERIREEVAAGHQAYIVCPQIEGEGGVEAVSEQLAHGPLKDLRVGLLHGRMPDKDERMAAFARGEIDVLVATTVVEVGVDVPNATVMLIRNAENFGVSQLHQLRGRVGRGGNASVCLLHTLAEEGTPAFNRVQAVAATNSGFELAELDLAQRQEGDVLGTEQSGTRRSLKLLNLLRDRDIIERSHADAFALVERNPDLALKLTQEMNADKLSYLEKS